MKWECEDKAKPKKKWMGFLVLGASIVFLVVEFFWIASSSYLSSCVRCSYVGFLIFLCYFSATWMRIASMQRDISNNSNLNRTFFHLILLCAGFCFFWFFFFLSQLAVARSDKFYFGYSFGLRSFFHSIPFLFLFYFILFYPLFVVFPRLHPLPF